MTPSDSPPTDRSPSRKAVLFCPACTHESPVDGDWLVRRERDSRVYRCPACRTAITTRPASRPEAPVLARWATLYADWYAYWTSWYRRATPS